MRGNCRSVETLLGPQDPWIRELGWWCDISTQASCQRWQYNQNLQAVFIRASQNSQSSIDLTLSKTHFHYPEKKSMGQKKYPIWDYTVLWSLYGKTQKWGVLCSQWCHRKKGQDRSKGRWAGLQWGSLVPSTKARKRWFARRGQYTPCNESMRDVSVNLWVSPRVSREHKLPPVSWLQEEEKEAFLSSVLGKATAEYLLAVQERIEFIETAFPVTCGICYQPVASPMFPSWLLCCWASNHSSSRALWPMWYFECEMQTISGS